MIKKINFDKPFYKKLWFLAFPIAFQSFMLAAVGAADSIMLGKLSQEAMSAVSLATQVQNVQNFFICALTSSGVILGAQYWGKGNREAVEKIFSIMLKMSSVVAIIFFAACEIIPSSLMWLFTSDRQLIEIGVGYLKVAGWSYLITGISQCYLAVMKITDKAKTGTIISSIAVVLNIILNSFFIFGILIFPKLEAKGAALATLIARVVELILVFVLSSGKDCIKLNIKIFFTLLEALSSDSLEYSGNLSKERLLTK